MHIMTKDGWKLLQPKVENHLYERQSFNFISKKWENDQQSGTLRFIGVSDHVENPFRTFDERAYWLSVKRYCDTIHRAVKESQERRAGF